jgi:nitric oxide reductase subunit C
MPKLWLGLFFLFVIYTINVYFYCDTESKKFEPPTDETMRGWKIWQSKNCQSCHQLYGLGGYLGPDLTNIASNPSKPEPYIRAILRLGTSKMPNFSLSDSEISQVVAFLKWVDKSGNSKVPASKVDLIGNYNLK